MILRLADPIRFIFYRMLLLYADLDQLRGSGLTLLLNACLGHISDLVWLIVVWAWIDFTDLVWRQYCASLGEFVDLVQSFIIVRESGSILWI